MTERRDSLQKARVELVSRLRARWPEIEQAAIVRLYGVADSPTFPDHEYTEGLRAAASAALEYLLDGVTSSERHSPEPPPAVLIQARLAARHGVSLDTVLRRCLAGYTLFGDFLIQEAEDGGLLQSAAVKRLLRAQAALFDRLIAAVTEEYTRDLPGRINSAEGRRARLVQGLLAGELLDATILRYELDAHHIGLVAAGPGAAEALRDFASASERRLLLTPGAEETAWAWLGSRRGFDSDDLISLHCAKLPDRVSLAIGEPGEGIAGWRLTHRQAKAALPIAMRSSEPIHYADVALLSTALHDEVLTVSLRRLYLDPLERERGDGETLRQTLRAYLAAGSNVSSAAISLGVKRHTVTNRLRAIEARINRPLNLCAAEIGLALRIEDLA